MKRKHILFILMLIPLTFCNTRGNIDKKLKIKFEKCLNNLEKKTEINEVIRNISYLINLTDTFPNIGDGWKVGEYLWGNKEKYIKDKKRWESWYVNNKYNISLEMADSIVKNRILQTIEKQRLEYICNHFVDIQMECNNYDSSTIETMKKYISSDIDFEMIISWGELKKDNIHKLNNILINSIRFSNRKNFNFCLKPDIIKGFLFNKVAYKTNKDSFLCLNRLERCCFYSWNKFCGIAYIESNPYLLTKYIYYCSKNENIFNSKSVYLGNDWYGVSIIDMEFN